MPSRLPLLLAFSLLPACVGLAPEASGPAEDDVAIPLPSPRPVRPTEPDAGAPGGDTGTPDGDTGTPDDTDGGEPDTGASAGSPLAGLRFWIDPDSNAAQEAASASESEAVLWRKISEHSVAKWLGGWSGDVESTVGGAVDTAEAAGSTMSFVVYNLPNRDCGGYSSGGAADRAEYEAWIDGIAAGIGGRTALVVLEPDGLSMMDCLSSSEADDRFAMLAYATATLKTAGAFVYIDAGHSAWHPADTMAARLVQAGVADADGFALNTSNYEASEELLAYGEEVSAGAGDAHFVGDTSRNGLGPTSSHEWCNPSGRALGLPPSTESGHPLADALLWVKAPGESDGSCNGGPPAGDWWPEYALGLAERAAW
ncbi:MAG: glycoside hydrolase family 6 protein [Pseudomonadota bacterium]|nr:glycoside hydrolase family 6 protein [Pseudomonadota bacterium]